MGEEHPRKRSRQHFEAEARNVSLFESPQCETSKWYFSREEIERFSPSRKDGIDLVKESFLRSSYCTFLQRLGMKLHVSQVTISCAMVMCHRFYMRQSHAKNDWQTIATSSLFLACKAEDEPCQLSSVVVASYEIIYEWDPSASIRIHQTECYHEFKEIILSGESLLLSTSAFHLDIELPYKPLAAALNRLNAWPDLATAAWNFVHDWIRTTLCLQYKPHVIATATVHLAATFQNAKVGSRRDWWLEFGVTTKLLKR
ncbi:Cyclin-T1-3 [Arabidopsis thaliana]